MTATAHEPLTEGATILKFLNSLSEPFLLTAEMFEDLLADHYAELQQKEKRHDE